mmetsp:Transcript_50320/g.90435  ORF Transcript_50320/g.90435 Transcript_50320/m.90435 type:complete len:204 (-) Transcript_50320:615-1226(-)
MCGEKCPLGLWQMPRSLAQRRTRPMSSLARRSIWPHSVIRAALCRGATLSTERSSATASGKIPSSSGARRVTFGSSPRNADLRNLKPPAETSLSVQILMADFCSLRRSVSLPFPLPFADRTASRLASAMGSTLMTMSTSGTATANALPRETSALAKPRTSASGSVLDRRYLMACARRFTASSLSAVGTICCSNSCTSASRPTP